MVCVKAQYWCHIAANPQHGGNSKATCEMSVSQAKTTSAPGWNTVHLVPPVVPAKRTGTVRENRRAAIRSRARAHKGQVMV